MSLAYALLTRFDIEAYMIALQKFLHKPKFIHIRRLNALVRWTQKNPKALKYMFMTCVRRLEVHSDTGFRREVTDEGDVDGKAARGINF